MHGTLQVLRGLYRDTQEVAIRTMECKTQGEVDAAMIREMSLLKSSRHPRIVNFLGVCLTVSASCCACFLSIFLFWQVVLAHKEHVHPFF